MSTSGQAEEASRKGARNMAQCGPRPGGVRKSTQGLCQKPKEDECSSSVQGGKVTVEGRGQRGRQGQSGWNLEPVLGNQAAGRQQVAAQLSWEQKKMPFSVPVEPVSMVDGWVGPQVHCQVSPSHILREYLMLEIFLAKHTTAEHECSVFVFSTVTGTSLVPPVPLPPYNSHPSKNRKAG